MKTAWALALCLACAGVALAQAPDKAPKPPHKGAASTTPGPTTQPVVTWRPPARGAPIRRVGGSTRGAGGGAPVVAVLAPEDTGLTLDEQPDLYWFISQPSAVRIALVLGSAASPAPVKEVTLQGVDKGIQRFSLREHGVRLAEGTDYEWSVAVIPGEAGAADLSSMGGIRRVTAESALAAKLRGLSGWTRAQALAEAGIWYDALDALGQELDATADPALRRVRADLLEQVGLAEAAAFERR